MLNPNHMGQNFALAAQDPGLQQLHSRELTWKPNLVPIRTTVLLKEGYLGFHVSLGECITFASNSASEQRKSKRIKQARLSNGNFLEIQGPQYRPQNCIPIMGTPRKVSLIYGDSQILIMCLAASDDCQAFHGQWRASRWQAMASLPQQAYVEF